MIEKIYIARHGFRLNWVTQKWSSPTGTPRDPPLAAYGEEQAKELAAYFLSFPDDEKPTAIFSSPFYRCIQTAAPTAAALKLPIYIENGVSEWYSPVVPGTGLHPIPPPASKLASQFPAFGIDPEGWNPPTYIPDRKGETVADVHGRCRTFLSAFIPRVEQLEKGRHKRILLFSHAATVIALTRELVGDRDMPLRVACCSLTTLTRDEEDKNRAVGVWKPVELAVGHYLKGGLERDWGFEDVELHEGQVVNDPGDPGTENDVQEAIGLQVAIPSKM